MKIEQEVGGSAETQNNYTGPARQLTVDTDNWDLRLHDGTTPGGNLIINRDNGDERWQGKSVELNGFDFSAEARGFLVRLGAGNYRIRILTVNPDQLEVANADGYSGSPVISIATRIETSHIFGANIAFEGDISVAGTISGNTSGTHTGNVTGNVVGNVLGNVTGDLAGDTFGTHTGNVDVRGAILQLDDNQIPNTKVDGLVDLIKAQAVPSGIIVMWSGLEADIPAGWFLCNGLNGTPDLRDRFIIGAGSLNYEPGDTGGAATHAHATSLDAAGAHTHTVSTGPHTLTAAEIPAHEHTNGVVDKNDSLFNKGGVPAVPTLGSSIDGNSSSGVREGRTSIVGGGGPHTHPSGTSSSEGTHNHTVNNPIASSLPPYYALAFIMRVVS